LFLRLLLFPCRWLGPRPAPFPVVPHQHHVPGSGNHPQQHQNSYEQQDLFNDRGMLRCEFSTGGNGSYYVHESPRRRTVVRKVFRRHAGAKMCSCCVAPEGGVVARASWFCSAGRVPLLHQGWRRSASLSVGYRGRQHVDDRVPLQHQGWRRSASLSAGHGSRQHIRYAYLRKGCKSFVTDRRAPSETRRGSGLPCRRRTCDGRCVTILRALCPLPVASGYPSGGSGAVDISPPRGRANIYQGATCRAGGGREADGASASCAPCAHSHSGIGLSFWRLRSGGTPHRHGAGRAVTTVLPEEMLWQQCVSASVPLFAPRQLRPDARAPAEGRQPSATRP
jgi:hypothetical protein